MRAAARKLTGSAVIVAACLAAGMASAQDVQEPQRVLVFGDSNGWGWVPIEEGVPTTRHAPEDRWPEVMQAELGDSYEVVVDALSGRTTDVDDPTAPMDGAALNGAEYLPAAIAAHLPLDLVVIMLGTNDTKAQFGRTPFRIALGAGHLVETVQASGDMFGGGWYDYDAPEVLLVAPPPMGPQTVFSETFEGDVGVARSEGLAPAYQAVAEAAGARFFDAGSAISTDGVDGVHFTAEAQRTLGEAMAEQVRDALE